MEQQPLTETLETRANSLFNGQTPLAPLGGVWCAVCPMSNSYGCGCGAEPFLERAVPSHSSREQCRAIPRELRGCAPWLRAALATQSNLAPTKVHIFRLIKSAYFFPKSKVHIFSCDQKCIFFTKSEVHIFSWYQKCIFFRGIKSAYFLPHQKCIFFRQD
jgi:hypothetical protein